MDTLGNKAALLVPEAVDLLESMPLEIKDVFIKCFLECDIKSAEAEKVRKFFRANSNIPNVVEGDSTSSITFEWLYRKQPPENPIDRFFCECESGRQIFQRLLILVENIPAIIRRQYTGNKLLIDNVGSGPGHDMIEVMANNPDLSKIVHIRHIDSDRQALDIGEKRVRSLGLQDSFSFMEGRLEDFSNGGASDIMLAIGILCPLPMGASRRVLRTLSGHLRPGGLIIYSTAQDGMRRDPLCDYIMRLFGWHMDHKTEQQAKELAQRVKLDFVDCFFDFPHRHHCMTVAMKP